MARRGTGPRLAWRRGAYVIRWTEDGVSRERATGARRREDAESIFATWIAERGRPERDRAGDPLISDLLGDYALEHGPSLAKSSRFGTGVMIERLLEFWAGRTVAAINKASCIAYAEHRRKPRAHGDGRHIVQGVADGTIRRELGILTSALNHAVAANRIAVAPRVYKPAMPQPRERWLTRDEAARLLRAARAEPKARGHLPLFILLALYGGARKGAILGLRWNQVDLENRRLSWNPAGERQTNKRKARIPIPRRLLTFLRLAKRRGGSDIGHVLTIDGLPIGSIRKTWTTTRRKAGLGEDVTPHTLRHTCGAWMAQDGVDLGLIALYLGHTHTRTTELYAHHSPDYLQRAADAMDRIP